MTVATITRPATTRVVAGVVVTERSPQAQSICEPRWAGKGYTPEVDPCGGCPLSQPCITQSTTRNMEEYNAWINRINALAKTLCPT